ncbi:MULTISPECIES: hypothetical protein [Bradyrhizobium]|uniref:hypothetical protein n=1 Tax=Bradyrhizobium TaxID=374 RepID=UPI0012BC4405|nr:MULTISPECIES: hypothetical protein [Bradyrhizobium]MCS3449269.1 hypothetical protein [Bradyrhizobium elkanii]MCS3559588.1 hypothetical protein [Bradyrhizobium elkanii]MCW2150566.1 hypothetical protein [Bradyrhizobium elkanii]MCW2359376.1 hypothetical protein [Bradyrhizobium elkanii]MCW2374297.1 hypothetical protein [Bradyrhizobium elkanii]
MDGSGATEAAWGSSDLAGSTFRGSTLSGSGLGGTGASASAGFAIGAVAADFDFSLASSSSIEGTDVASSGTRGGGAGGVARTGGGDDAIGAGGGGKSAGANWANLPRAISSALSKSGLSIQAFDCTSVTRASHRRAASMS